MKKLTLPLREEDIKGLKAGDSVLLTGSMLTGRDAAHKRLYELIEQGKELPVDIQGETIYYVGPAPAKPGHAVGPAGPTSSYRMDKYAPALLDRGLKAMVGKGARSKEVIDAIVRNGGVYFAAIGGAAALIVYGVLSILVPSVPAQISGSSMIRIDGSSIFLLLCVAAIAAGAALLLKSTKHK